MNQHSSPIASSSAVQLRRAGADTTLVWAGPRSIAPAVRLSLALEQIRGGYDAAVLKLYLGESEDIFLGSVALYGLRRASAGLSSHLDIPAPALTVITASAAAGIPLPLFIRPNQPLPDGVEIAIERIALYADTGS